MNKKLLSVFTIISTLILGWFSITLLVSYNPIKKIPSDNDVFLLWSPVMIISAFVAFILLVSFVYFKIPQHLRKYFNLFFIFLVGLEMIFSIFLYPMGGVYDQVGVERMAYSFSFDENPQWGDYFRSFPNNVNVVILISKINKVLGKTIFSPLFSPEFSDVVNHGNYQLVTTLWVMTLNFLAVIALWFVLKQINEFIPTIFTAIYSVFFVFTVTFSQIGYSDTIGIPLSIIGSSILLLALLKKDVLKKYSFILWSLIGGVFVSLGLLVRPNLFISVLALFIAFAFVFYKSKHFYMQAIIVFASLLLAVSGFGLVKNRSNFTQNKDLQFPINYWIYTSYVDGGRSGKTIQGVKDKFPVPADGVPYINKHLKDKILELGPVGIVDLYQNKLNILTGMANDFGMQSYTATRYSTEQNQKEFSNKYKTYISKMINVSRIAVIPSAIIAPLAFIGFKKRDEKTKAIILFLSTSVIGNGLFYILLWEVQEHYGFILFPFNIALAAIGIYNLFELNKTSRETTAKAKSK